MGDESQGSSAHLSVVQVERMKTDLAALDAEILALRRKREEQALSLASVSTMHQTPTEIWKLIFLYTLPMDHDAIISTAHPPLVLTHVCGRWRSLALGTPALWSTVHIPIITPLFISQVDLDASTPELRRVYDKYRDQCARVMANREAMLRIWLMRAQKLPLSVTVDHHQPRIMYTQGSHTTVGPVDNASGVITLLREYAGQWGSWRLNCKWVLADLLLRDIQPSQAPELDSLTFSDAMNSQGLHLYNIQELARTPLLQSPNLRHFRPPPFADNLSWRACFISLRVGMGSLTGLHIPGENGKVSTTEVITILASCPLLVTLDVCTTCKLPHVVPGRVPAVRLGYVENLTWKEEDKEPLNGSRESSLLSFLELPSLHTLTLQFPRHSSRPADVDVPHPLRGLSTCGHTVKTLSVTMGRLPLSSTQIQIFLQSIPNVESLELNCNILPSFSRDLFRILSVPGGVLQLENSEQGSDAGPASIAPPEPLLCHKLLSLTWTSQHPDFYEQSVLDFLHARRLRPVPSNEHVQGGPGVAKLLKLRLDITLPRPYSKRPHRDPLAAQRLLAAVAALGDVDVEDLVVDFIAWPPFPVPDSGWSPSVGAIPESGSWSW